MKSISKFEALQVLVAIFGIFVAVYIPYRIESSQRDLQNQGNCTTAVLNLRRDLASFYDLGDNGVGGVKQNADWRLKQADPAMAAQEDGRMLAVRRTAQNARDTVYVLCRELGNPELTVNPANQPWVDSPSDVEDLWSRKNIKDILRETSVLIDRIAKVKPGLL